MKYLTRIGRSVGNKALDIMAEVTRQSEQEMGRVLDQEVYMVNKVRDIAEKIRRKVKK